MPRGTLKLGQKALAMKCQNSSDVYRESEQDLDEVRTPSRILFVRNRILYARAALNAQGDIRYGFRHNRMLNGIPF